MSQDRESRRIETILLGHIAKLNAISSMRRVLDIAIYFFEFGLDFEFIETEAA